MRNAFRGNQTVWFEREKFDCQQFFTNENERVQPAVFGTMLCYQSFTKHTLSSFWSASYISMEDTVDKRWYFLRYLNIVISRNVTHWKLYNIKYKSQGEVPTEAMTNCNENFGWTLQNDINFLPTVAEEKASSRISEWSFRDRSYCGGGHLHESTISNLSGQRKWSVPQASTGHVWGILPPYPTSAWTPPSRHILVGWSSKPTKDNLPRFSFDFLMNLCDAKKNCRFRRLAAPFKMLLQERG